MLFHPTALHHPEMPRPLLSEALRGHGALLRDASGDRFVDELAPRDVVARAMAALMAAQGVDHLWLDATGLEGFDQRFPTIAAALHRAGLDPANEWLPIAPAAHYLIGGLVTDLDGATSMPGLWAAGEVACTGVHGANRLASNSLLEGMVFAARVVESAVAGKVGADPTGAMAAVASSAAAQVPNIWVDRSRAELAPSAPADITKQRELLQRVMTSGAGVVRDAASLAGALDSVAGLSAGADPSRQGLELANLIVVATALVTCAVRRQETRGAHNRTDFPETSPDFAHRLVIGG